MRKTFVLFWIVIGTCTVTQAAPQRVEEPEGPPATTPAARDEYAPLFDLPGLTDTQKADMEKAVAKRNADLLAFNESEQGKQLLALRLELASARKAKDNDKLAELWKKIVPLQRAYAQIRVDAQVAILGLLTRDQLTEYVSSNIRSMALRSMPQVQWTPPQSEKIDALCLSAAGEYLKNNILANDPFFLKVAPLAKQVRATVEKEVVTPQQRGNNVKPLPQPMPQQEAP